MRSKGDHNVEQRGSKCGAKGIKVQSKVDQNADQNAEKNGAKRGARWSKTILFLFDSKLESCLKASSFKYRIMEISEKGLY